MSVQVGNGFSIGSMGMIVSALAIPAEAPSIVYTSKTTTTITIAHTIPSDTSNYATSVIFVNGVQATTSATTGAIVLSGLVPATRYAIYAVSQSAGGAQLASSPVLIVDTSADAGSSLASSIKAAIRTIVVSVAGVTSGTVHARRRKPIGQSTATQQSLFEVSGVVDCWEIEEETLGSTWAGVNVAWHHTPDTYVIRSWRQWDDANNSIDSHRATVEGVIDALNADITLGGTVNRHDTVQVRRHGELEMKAGRLCSVVELVIDCYATRKP